MQSDRPLSAEERWKKPANVKIMSFADQLRELNEFITKKLEIYDIFDLPVEIKPHFREKIQEIVDKRELRCTMEVFKEIPSGEEFLCVTVGLATADFEAFEARR